MNSILSCTYSTAIGLFQPQNLSCLPSIFIMRSAFARGGADPHCVGLVSPPAATYEPNTVDYEFGRITAEEINHILGSTPRRSSRMPRSLIRGWCPSEGKVGVTVVGVAVRLFVCWAAVSLLRWITSGKYRVRCTSGHALGGGAKPVKVAEP